MNVSNQVTLRSPRNNGQNMMLVTNVVDDRSSHEISQSQVPVQQNGVMHGAWDSHQSFTSRVDGHPNVNCLAFLPEEIVGFDEVGRIPFGALLLERSWQQRSDTSPSRTLNPVSPRCRGQILHWAGIKIGKRISTQFCMTISFYRCCWSSVYVSFILFFALNMKVFIEVIIYFQR